MPEVAPCASGIHHNLGVVGEIELQVPIGKDPATHVADALIKREGLNMALRPTVVLVLLV